MRATILQPLTGKEEELPTLYARGSVMSNKLDIKDLECGYAEMRGNIRVIIEPECTFHDDVSLYIGSVPRGKPSGNFPDVGLVASFREHYGERQLQLRRRGDVVALFILPPNLPGDTWELPEFWADSEVLYKSDGAF